MQALADIKKKMLMEDKDGDYMESDRERSLMERPDSNG